nr:hypothetical protein [Lachnospiraceae bacterium]
KWYNMDVTWDDLDSKYGDISGDGQVDAYYFEYTLRNDQNFIYDTNYQLTGDLTSYLSHYASSDWEYYGIPKAKRDSNPSGRYYTTIGTI